jgi:NADPH:quinone reductase-like Zn-dependent oxidoreductase
MARMFEEMNKAIETHDIHPVIDKVFDFADTLEAIKYFRSQAHLGKVVINIS